MAHNLEGKKKALKMAVRGAKKGGDMMDYPMSKMPGAKMADKMKKSMKDYPSMGKMMK